MAQGQTVVSERLLRTEVSGLLPVPRYTTRLGMSPIKRLRLGLRWFVQPVDGVKQVCRKGTLPALVSYGPQVHEQLGIESERYLGRMDLHCYGVDEITQSYFLFIDRVFVYLLYSIYHHTGSSSYIYIVKLSETCYFRHI